ncbi:MAG TPA: patatin-like phospholipase family protein [Geminicoccaceae bacterium]|nr:patatin-like phospholipase family protein [Geminicoccaceae bacterium]
MSAGGADTETKRVNLALQGGGAHGAFTWGVLDRLLEDERIEIEGICGTSAGAMNGVAVAHGLEEGGAAGARRTLDRFWYAVAELGRFSPIQRSPIGHALGTWRLDTSPSYLAFDYLTRMLSPYQTNPCNYHPLERVLEEVVDFAVVRRCTAIKLFICATNVRTGKIKVFGREEVCREAILASACLPFLFQAVEYQGEYYWDGGYMGNPAIFPLIYGCASPDVIIVQINPLFRDTIPITAREIMDRVNEISFNSSLMREMRAIAFVSRLLEQGKLDPAHYKSMNIHLVEADEQLKPLGASSKLNAERAFLEHLKAIGREACDRWLDRNFDQIGVSSTVDLAETYL